jgi:hypothetical protein
MISGEHLSRQFSVENQDALDAALLDAVDDFQGAVFNALCGFYRLSFTSLRSVVELVVIGCSTQITENLSAFEKWRAGKLTISFDTAALQSLRRHLQTKLSDSLFDPKNPKGPGGWARRSYSALSNYSHSRPGHTDGDSRESNGPIYVPKAFVQAVRMHIEVAAFGFVLIKLARRNFVLPRDGEEVFLAASAFRPRTSR